MDQFFFYELTSGGGNLDNYVADYGYVSLIVYNDNPVSLSGSFSINPTTPSGPVGFQIKWQALTTTNAYPVSICGVTISQDCLNQPGLFSCYYNTALSPAGWEVQYYPDFIEKPQENPGVTTISVPTSGTLTLEAGVDTSYIRLLGSPTTLVGSYAVDGLIGAKDGSQFIVEISGNITIGANAFTVFGQTIPAYMADTGGGMVLATYDAPSSVWRSILVNKNVTIADLDSVPALSIPANATNATANLASLEFLTDGGVLQRSGTALTTGLLTSANFGANAIIPQVNYTNISSAELLDAFNTPIQVLPSPTGGSLNWIQGIIIISSVNVSPFVAYDTNTDVQFFFNGASNPIATDSGVLAFSTDIIKYITPTNSSGANSNVISGQALQLQVPSGNPLNGTGTISVGIIYCVIPPVAIPTPLP